MDLYLEPLSQQPSERLLSLAEQELARQSQVLAGFLFRVATAEGESHLTLGVRLSPLIDAKEQMRLVEQLDQRLGARAAADEPINVARLDDETLRRVLAVATLLFHRETQILDEEDALLAAEVHFNQGNVFDDDGQRAQAIQEWERAVQLDPEHGGAHYNLGLAYADDGKTEFALFELRQAVKLDPFDTDAAHDLADLLLEQERVDEAISVLRQCLTLNPRARESALELATIYLDNEMLDEAFGALDQAAGALELESSTEEDAELWFELGQGYTDAGRIDDAILAYRRAIGANPDHPDAIAALREMGMPIEEPDDED